MEGEGRGGEGSEGSKGRRVRGGEGDGMGVARTSAAERL